MAANNGYRQVLLDILVVDVMTEKVDESVYSDVLQWQQGYDPYASKNGHKLKHKNWQLSEVSLTLKSWSTYELLLTALSIKR
uniref:Uncharacterized protein n=1 Tax=Acrobeloides nanus TaxID=290746 RepID=A0A914E114_9BILA